MVMLLLTFLSVNTHADIYKYKSGFEIKAKDYKTAAKLCYIKLTNNKYPGDERGLEIIDICVNPIKGKVN